MSAHRELLVWQRSMALAKACYLVTRSFPKEELFGMTSQLRRAAVSVASNIAEGNGLAHRRAYLNHLSMSRGSLNEVETLLELAVELEFVSEKTTKPAFALASETGALLTLLRRSLSK